MATPESIQKRLVELVQRAENDELSALEEIRQLYDEHPELWRAYGDLDKQVKLALADLIAGPDIALKEAALRKAGELKDELAGAEAPPLERLLAANISTCWLAVAQAELAAIRARQVSLAQADFYEKRRAQAQKRLLAASKTLATVQKLLRPLVTPLQVASRLEGGARTTPARRRTPPTPAEVLN